MSLKLYSVMFKYKCKLSMRCCSISQLKDQDLYVQNQNLYVQNQGIPLYILSYLKRLVKISVLQLGISNG